MLSKVVRELIESHLSEASVSDLLNLSIRDKKGAEQFPIRLTGYSHWDKTFKFNVKDYKCQIRVPDLKVISRLKGTDEDKLTLALDSDIKVNCSCPDFKFRFRYVAGQYDASTKQENRPPEFTNPDLNGSICKHLHSLLRRLPTFKEDMAKYVEDSRSQDYKTVNKKTDYTTK